MVHDCKDDSVVGGFAAAKSERIKVQREIFKKDSGTFQMLNYLNNMCSSVVVSFHCNRFICTQKEPDK